MSKTKFNLKYSKIRVIQFCVAELVLFAGTWVIYGGIEHSVFWPLTIGLAVPTLFGEPYFTPPRAALLTAVSQAGSFFAADRTTAPDLWLFLVALSGLVAISSLVSIATRQEANGLFHWIATRFGRPVALGSVLSLVLIVQAIVEDQNSGIWLAMLLIAFYALIFPDWSKLFIVPSRISQEVATLASVIAPNQLLLSTYSSFTVGQRVEVESSNGKALGYIAEELASDSGSRYRVVLDGHWRSVANDISSPCLINPAESSDEETKGFAIQGSTESTISLNPIDDIKIGDTLATTDVDGQLFYQVAGLELREEHWSSSAAIVPRAKLIQIGALGEDGRVVVRPALPAPYQRLASGANATADLSDDFMRIGVMKGTDIPIGIKRGWQSSDGHLAVLGMSGMGKTTVAAKLTNLAGEDDRFVVLDETSEYRTRLGHAPVSVNDLKWDEGCLSVCEPGGDLPTECRKIVEAAMKIAHEEYSNGNEPRRRFILLEEAHGWLPEWNFSTQAQSSQVSLTSRFILQARKFNLTFVVVSQRTAVISKSALSQCENYIILRTLDQTSLDYVEGIVGQQLKGVIPELQRYEAICSGPLFNSDSPVIVSLDP